ncbi:MAG: SDR family NAD(P)-dependent oxidoreductase [Candidatus Binataceae bacterium]
MASDKLKDKIAIVTGGGDGLGRAMALGLAENGARVVITSARNPGKAMEAAAQANRLSGRESAIAIAADVSIEKDCLRTVETALSAFGAIHILVNNAGRGMRFIDENFLERPAKFWEAEVAAWRMIIETNVNGPFLMAKAAVPYFLKQNWGRVINISMNHETMRRAGFSPYGPSKAALESETIIWARDLADTGITVNALLPGGIANTGMVPAQAAARIRGTLLDPSIMVAPLLWLASEESGGANGQRFNAKNWDSALPAAQAAQGASEAAGF